MITYAASTVFIFLEFLTKELNQFGIFIGFEHYIIYIICSFEIFLEFYRHIFMGLGRPNLETYFWFTLNFVEMNLHILYFIYYFWYFSSLLQMLFHSLNIGSIAVKFFANLYHFVTFKIICLLLKVVLLNKLLVPIINNWFRFIIETIWRISNGAKLFFMTLFLLARYRDLLVIIALIFYIFIYFSFKILLIYT